MTGVELIRRERLRQLRKGYGSGHDDRHDGQELVTAATCYLDPPLVFGGLIDWPFEVTAFKPANFRPGVFVHPKSIEDRIDELVKAGALIAAEIDRLGRL